MLRALSTFLVLLSACDSYGGVEGEVLADNLVVENVDFRSGGEGEVSFRLRVRNAGGVDFSEVSVALTVVGDGTSRLVGGAVPGGLPAGESGEIVGAASGPPLGGIRCYRYSVSVAATSEDQTIATSAEYPGTCAG